MSFPYLIYTDLSADMDAQVAAQYDIHLVPMGYTVGDEERICTGFEDPALLKAFYESQREGKVTHTTQVTPQQYKDVFGPLMQQGAKILYIALSSGLSGTYAASCLVAEELNEQYPQGRLETVDSLCATAGMGLLLEAAGKNRDAGMSLEDNAAWLRGQTSHVAHWFMVEDLMYLKRGGRVSAATALVGTALNIKPILKIEADGTLSSFAKKRGVKSALAQLGEYFAQSQLPDMDNRVYVIHADAPEKAAILREAVLAAKPDAVISEVFLCPVIGSHVGPGMAAIVHWGQR